MDLVIPRAPLSERLREVRTMLSYIKAAESDHIPPIDSEEVKILRGLFYVHLYGALEQSLNEAVDFFLNGIAVLNLRHKDLNTGFLPTAMNAHFKSLMDVQSQRKWKKRIDFVYALASEDFCKIETAIFSPHLQSADMQTICEVISYMGISTTELDVSPDRHYIDEVVQKRHQVAHGRTNPSTIGANGRSPDLQLRLEAVYRMIELFLQTLEHHFNTSRYLRNSEL